MRRLRCHTVLPTLLCLSGLTACGGTSDGTGSAGKDDSAQAKPAPSGCDTTTLQAAAINISTARAAWKPSDGTVPGWTDEAAKGVLAACPALPAGFKRYLEALRGSAPDQRGSELSQALPSDDTAVAAALDAVCPEREAAAKAWWAGRDTNAWVAACQLDKLGVASAAELAAHKVGPGSLTAFALHHYLAQRGVPAATLAPLSRELVASRTHEPVLVEPMPGQKLPDAAAVKPLDEEVLTYVGLASTTVSGTPTALSLGCEKASVAALEPFKDALREELEPLTAMAQRRGENAEFTLALVADRRCSASSLEAYKSVALSAGYASVARVAIRSTPPHDLGSIAIDDSSAPLGAGNPNCRARLSKAGSTVRGLDEMDDFVEVALLMDAAGWEEAYASHPDGPEAVAPQALTRTQALALKDAKAEGAHAVSVPFDNHDVTYRFDKDGQLKAADVDPNGEERYYHYEYSGCSGDTTVARRD